MRHKNVKGHTDPPVTQLTKLQKRETQARLFYLIDKLVFWVTEALKRSECFLCLRGSDFVAWV